MRVPGGDTERRSNPTVVSVHTVCCACGNMEQQQDPRRLAPMWAEHTPRGRVPGSSAVAARRCTPALAARIVAAGVGRREIAFFGDAPRARALVGSGSASVEHRL